MTQIQNGNAIFTNRLYQALSTRPGNVFFSPFSIHAILSMTYQGAEKETAKILAQSLGISDPRSTAEAYKCLLDEMLNLEAAPLLVAFKIYVGRQEVFKEQFERSVNECFHSEAEFLDFEAKSEAVAAINGWVEEKTRSKIRSGVDEGSIDEETAMLLINALYFKSDWLEQFRESNTQRQEFLLDGTSTVEVQMMHMLKTSYYKYHEDLEAQIVGLPFLDRAFKLFILLPADKGGIGVLETKLATLRLDTLTQNLDVVVADLSLPKFKLEVDLDFKPVLLDLGLENIFDKNAADFKGMVDLKSDENLCVDGVIQKGVLEVNEWGAEAATASFVRMRKVKKSSCQPQVVRVVVDHPALFMLTYKETNILFFGRLADPKY